MKLQQNREAAALYEMLTRDYPKYAKLDAALYDWAWTLRELGQSAESDKLYLRLRKDFPQSRYWADASYRLAQRAFENQDVAQRFLFSMNCSPANPSRRSANSPFISRPNRLARQDWGKIRPAFRRLLAEFRGKQRMLAEFGSPKAIIARGLRSG
jgi:TolA-binding protein